MAITILNGNYVGIPRSLDWKCTDGEAFYVMKEHSSHKMYISRVPLHPYTDRDRIDRSATLFCKSTVERRRIRLTEDAIKYLFRWCKNASGKIIMTKGYTYREEEVLYLKPIEE